MAIIGASGSGKSTLLGLLAGLDVATAGEVVLAGQPLSGLDEDARAALRDGTVQLSLSLANEVLALCHAQRCPEIVVGGIRAAEPQV